MTEMEPILEARNLTRSYRSGSLDVTALRNVSFQLAPGSTSAIVGPSGSGKTTLLALCAGLDQPTSGEVILGSVSLKGLGEEELAELRRDRVGFVFQSFRLLPTLTALENVMVPLELRGDPSARDEASERLRRVGLAERAKHYPQQLSGGEQQRVALARAFVHRPALLFADEPTGNLDGDSAALVEELLFELNEVHQTTLVLVTHNLELAGRADRILHLRAGQLVRESPAIAAPENAR